MLTIFKFILHTVDDRKNRYVLLRNPTGRRDKCRLSLSCECIDIRLHLGYIFARFTCEIVMPMAWVNHVR